MDLLDLDSSEAVARTTQIYWISLQAEENKSQLQFSQNGGFF